MNIVHDKTKKEVSKIVKSIGTPNISNILDLGANIGLFSLYFAKLCPSAVIYSFEPVKPTYDILKENIELNELNNIVAVNVGISNKECNLELGIPSDRTDLKNVGLYSIHENSSNNGQVLQMAQFIKLQTYLTEVGITSFDIIKMDVEGCELMIIEDNLELFKNSKSIHIECNDIYKSDNLKIKSYLKEMGYKYIMNTSKINELWKK